MATTYIQRIRRQPARNKLLYVAGAGAIVWYIFKYKPTPQQQDYLDAARSMLAKLANEFGVVPSLSNSNFNSLALNIRNAVDGCGTDETAIYNAFEALNNEADLYRLIEVFGVSKYLGCTDDAGFWSRNTHKVLSEALVSDLTSYERSIVNAILADKNIYFRF